MAGLRGKTAYFAVAKQTAKGAPNANAKHAYPFAGGSIAPTRDTDRLQETDDSRDAGATYVKTTGVSGNPQVYARDNSVDTLLAAALGTVADSGTTNFTHTITPATALPYLTAWRMLGDTLFEKFTDSMVSDLTLSSSAGSPLTAQATILGLASTRLTVDPLSGFTPAVTIENGTVYTFNDVTVTLSGGATALVSSFEMTISNNVTVQQTNSSIPYDLVPGTREISLSFDLIFETLAEYNAFHYGSTSGTTQASTLYTTAANFTFAKGINNSINLDFPIIAYEEFPVDPQPDGSPVTASIRASVQRPAAGSNMMSAIVKNQKAATF